ncbi:MAG: sulfatase-like hydrolase/transferase, partial [Verrucomicrobiota bacterium]
EDPFFLYVAYTAAHWPMHALERDHAKYRGKYDAGYDATQKARYERMLERGAISAENTQIVPVPEGAKETEYLDWDIANMEVYAAMVDSMDQGIGRLCQALKETGQWENTLICYLQDNGGCAETYGRTGKPGGPRAETPTLDPLPADYLQPDMNPTQTRDGYLIRRGKGVMPGPADTLIGYGKAWAAVSNTPFREYKHFVHEGGIATPLIAHWPDGISRSGEWEKTPGHLIDLMATAVDLGGANYPETNADGESIVPMEGTSLRPLFSGGTLPERTLYWEHEGNRAIRQGDWKLVAKGAKGAWELYDLSKDRSEVNNLAAQEPERVATMQAAWEEWAERASVMPLNPRRQVAKD